VPVIRLEHLSDTQARAYMLADNKLADRSDWDDAKLAAHLKELSELVLDFDIEATGFESPEIDLRIQSLEEPEAAEKADEFEFLTGPAYRSLATCGPSTPIGFFVVTRSKEAHTVRYSGARRLRRLLLTHPTT